MAKAKVTFCRLKKSTVKLKWPGELKLISCRYMKSGMLKE